jgi:hypothetical protein
MNSQRARRWRLVTWVGICTLTLVAAVSAASFRWMVACQLRRGDVLFFRSELQVHRLNRFHFAPSFRIFAPDWPDWESHWLPQHDQTRFALFTLSEIDLPVWTVAVPLLLATLLAGQHARTLSRIEGCEVCGYPRDGLQAQAPCPECGTATEEVSKVAAEKNAALR